MRIANNVEMLEIKRPDGTLHLTLVWDDNNLGLIDTGFPGQTEEITQAITDAGFAVENITHIILTHQDMDHIGCLPDLLKLAPAAKVLAHVEEAPYIDGRKTPVKLEAMLRDYDALPPDRREFCDRFKAGFKSRRTSIDQTLTDGEVLPICGGIEVVHTPGHTPGHICLYLKESRILVAGDALNIADGKLTGPNPQHTHDMPLGLQSAEKAKAYKPNAVVSYHCGYCLYIEKGLIL